MNYLRQNPVGIDEQIQRIQSFVYDKIISNWNLDSFNSYGRVYKNKRNGLIIPEYYVSEKEYEEVLLNDNLNGIMFFSPSDRTEVNGTLLTQDCDLIFTFNLSDLNISNERDDENVRQGVLSILRQYDARIDFVKQITTGLTNVYQDYNGVANYFYDMQNFHHFKVTLGLRYNNNIKCI